jgi:hypothetical protein
MRFAHPVSFIIFFILLFQMHGIAQLQSRKQRVRQSEASEQAMIVAIAPISLLARNGKINLRAEYAYRPNRSVSLLLGVPINTDAPNWVVNALTFNDPDSNKTVTNRYKSFAMTVGHRFYFGVRQPAFGFYVEPYLRYNRFTVTHTVRSNETVGDTKVVGKIGGPGIGAAVGGQVRIGQHVTIDLTLFGADMRILGGSLRYSSNDPNNDIVAFKARVQEKVADIPIVGGALAAELDGDAVRVRTPGIPLPGFRCNLTVGYAF